MELTEIQLDAVQDEVNILLGDIFLDDTELYEICDLILDDVVQDIEETADWSNYDEDEYCLYDVRIALARVLKNAIVSKYTGE